MDGPTQYLQWGFLQISVANLIVIGLMLALFALAVVARWGGGKNRASTILSNSETSETNQSEATTPTPVEKTEVKV